MDRKIYLDNAATTYVSGEVLNEMMPCFSAIYGNSNSIHSFGHDAVSLVDRARDRIAKSIICKSKEIYFTSGGTESNNWAIIGLAHANCGRGKHIIVSKIEHDSILESCKKLEEEGFEITYLNVDSEGLVSIAELLHYIRKDTILVSVMTVNNEIGTIQNIKTISQIAHENGALFHTDAVQAIGHISFDVGAMGIDAMSMSAHKIHGPKGIGALFVKESVNIEKFMNGGNQERNKRGGTLNVPCIVGFGKAMEIANRDIIVNNQKLKSIRDYFVKKLTEKVEYMQINGNHFQRVPNIVSISFELIKAESLLVILDLEGVCASTGSACEAGSVEPSHVLKALKLDENLARGTVRFSFAKSITREDVDYAVETIANCVSKLRGISALTKTGRAK